MGRKKIAIKKISDTRRRQVTFVRRKFGLMKKAYELSVLCDCDVALLMITPDQKLYLYSNKTMQEMVLRYNEITTAPEDCEIIGDDEMVKMIERGKECLEDYFGNEDDDYEEEEDHQKDEYERKTRRRSSIGPLPTKKAKTVPVTLPNPTPSEEQPPQPQMITPHYYYAAPAQGFGQNFMPYQPYVLYPHPNFQNAEGEDGGKTHPSTGNNSALHLPPLPFTFAQPDGSGSSQSLNPPDGTHPPSLPPSGSTMFAGGMYYPFGAPWPMQGSTSTGELRNANSTMDLIAAAASAESQDSNTQNRATVKEKKDTMESVNVKEENAKEEATKSKEKQKEDEQTSTSNNVEKAV